MPADASTIIYLAKADAFGPAATCMGEIIVGSAVWRESVEAGERRGAIEVARIRVAAESGHLKRIALSATAEAKSREIAKRYALGSGESEVLALARRGGWVLMDEGRGTRVAEWLGIIPVSTLHIPVVGGARHRLSNPGALELLRRLAVVVGARADLVLRLEEIIRRSTA